MRLTIDEYSKNFKMSKEMINSRLKTKRLNYIIENGITYIITPQKPKNNQDNNETIATSKAIAKPKTTVATVLALYQRENQQLKHKIVQLEEKIDKLIDDKEQMLRNEMQKIEQVYNAKDEQLKSILELVNKKLIMDYNPNSNVHDVETIETEKIIKQEEKPKLKELRTYLRTLSLKSYQRKVIKKRFLAVHNNDVRIIQQNGKLYLDFSKYDYSDLLDY
ncbi:MAG: hypothetical protein K8R44_04910 [Sulfurimonas sp.]|nr:hypothetical protein [Sulfurimonas sp.]